MTHELGISVYPDLSSMVQIEAYFERASRYGVTKVFSSLFSVEGSKEEILAYFEELIEKAHRYHLTVSLDVNPMAFEKLGASPTDLSIFHTIAVDCLRLDLSFGAEKDAQLINNPYGIAIEFNQSPTLVKDLLGEGIAPERIQVCHNFYPQRYTAMKWKTFLERNAEIKKLSNAVRISAFISSNAPNTHGVWEAKSGLPTVERLRFLPIDLQARMLLATGQIDDLLIGNAYASEEEFQALQEVWTCLTADKKDRSDHPMIDMLVAHGMLQLDSDVKILRLHLEPDATETEQDILWNFYPHIDFGDSSEWIWRNRLPRFKYSEPTESIPPRTSPEAMFQPGDVLVVNDSYKHYAGELQIVRQPIVNDGTRNKVAHLDEEEQGLLELISDGDRLVFLKA